LVTRDARRPWVWLTLALMACGEEPTEVRLDLCPPVAATPDDLALLDGVSTWNVDVLGLEGDDVAWRRSFEGSEPLTLDAVEIASAVPRGADVRLIVEGAGLDADNRERLLAVASSDRLTLVGDERICLCVAPPETYAELCLSRSCTFSVERGTCWASD
jgi:hypothetical protein